MSPRTLRWVAILDVVAIPLLIAAFLWRLQFLAPRSWIVFPIWLTASWLLHRDTPKTLGWRADNFWPAMRQAGTVFAMVVGVLVAIGLAMGSPNGLPQRLFSLRRLWQYFAFCMLQQVALQSFLNNRLMSLISRRWLSSLACGLIFGALHWPNPVLVPVTFVGGFVLAWLFARQRNILPLAVGQAILGTLTWWAFPLAWHHSLRVGPVYYLPY